MSGQKCVCIDLDGTIAYYDDWKGERRFGDPVPGVQAALWQFRSAGWKIIIYTTRGNRKLVANYLNRHSIPFDHINHNPDQPKDTFTGKPYAEAYIDDRGIQFNGNWQSTANELMQFVPWEKRAKADQGDEYRKEAISFLGRDFGEAFSQLRAYDAQIWDILKYSFGQLVGSIAAVWAIFSLANGTNAPAILSNLWKPVGASILVISYLFGLLALQLILRNRVYFSAAARYINDQRGFFLSSKPIGFGNLSHYYTDCNLPRPFDVGSTQVLSVYAISLIGTLLLGFGVGLLGQYFGMVGRYCVVLGVAVWLISCACTIWYALHYLALKKNQTRNPEQNGMTAPTKK
jgi:hypothetical protein